MQKVGERPGCLRAVGVFMGVLTFIAGLIGTIEIFCIPLPFVAFISYLLCTSNRFYVRHQRLVAAVGVIAAIAGVGLFITPFVHPAFQEASLGAGLYGFLFVLAGLFALADASVLFIRPSWA